MRAVRYHGRGDVRVDQIDEPVCGEGEVKVLFAFPTLHLHYARHWQTLIGNTE